MYIFNFETLNLNYILFLIIFYITHLRIIEFSEFILIIKLGN